MSIKISQATREIEANDLAIRRLYHARLIPLFCERGRPGDQTKGPRGLRMPLSLLALLKIKGVIELLEWQLDQLVEAVRARKTGLAGEDAPPCCEQEAKQDVIASYNESLFGPLW